MRSADGNLHHFNVHWFNFIHHRRDQIDKNEVFRFDCTHMDLVRRRRFKHRCDYAERNIISSFSQCRGAHALCCDGFKNTEH